MIWGLWFSVNFFYYGTIFILPYWLAYLDPKGGANKDDNHHISLPHILFPFLSELPSILFSYNLVEHPMFGRKRTVILACLFAVLFSYKGYTCEP
jgi:hypothetical protein